MITLLLAFISQLNITQIPTAQVEAGGAEVEAVFVPAGYVGPIVAAPFTARTF
jgi:hypothetical protein